MQLIFLVIQIILAVAIIGTILLQRNGVDGLSGLGGAGSIGGTSIISSRTTASFLSKATAFLMACFMINCLILGNMAVRAHNAKSVIEQVINSKQQDEKAVNLAPTNE